MPIQLGEGQQLKRSITVYGIGQVEVAISNDGVSFRVPGTQKKVTAPWTKVVASCDTPTTVKSYHMGRPTDFLKAQIESVQKKAAERQEKI